MNHGSLFSGIGGFDLAAQWMGWENIFQVEKDEFCQKVLTKNFPHVKRYGDIKQFDGTPYRGSIDILTGGFPCQPYSTAGKRKGKEDERHLWPEMLRVIREIQPAYVVGENVHGLVNWSGGMVFDEVQANLEAEGFEVTSVVLPACGINAPHRRERIWFISYTDRGSSQRRSEKPNEHVHHWNNRDREESAGIIERLHDPRTLTDTESERRGEERPDQQRSAQRPTRVSSEWNAADTENIGRQRIGASWNGGTGPTHGDYRWQDWPAKPGVCGADDGVSNRVDRIKSLGNAIVPQVAFEIFKSIEATLK